ncbi:hypothetical protein BC829DRAFT_439791 [Chytridium lagenaria]|nr:hypothetical protein BC829DRAFT_439791 [Chytridium lagenaria]
MTSSLCDIVRNITDVSLQSQRRCLPSQLNVYGSMEPWISYNTQIGFTASHGILALTTLVVVLASALRTRKSWSDLTGYVDWKSLSDVQVLCIGLHGMALLLSIAFLTNFTLYLFHIRQAYHAFTLLIDILTFSIQILSLALSLRSRHKEGRVYRREPGYTVVIGGVCTAIVAVGYVGLQVGHVIDFGGMQSARVAYWGGLAFWGVRG